MEETGEKKRDGSLYGREKGSLAGDWRLGCLVCAFCDYPLFLTNMEARLAGTWKGII